MELKKSKKFKILLNACLCDTGNVQWKLRRAMAAKHCLALALPLESKLSKDEYNDEYYEKDEIPGWHRRTGPLISESFSTVYATTTRRGNSS